jgi:hypothetical protein
MDMTYIKFFSNWIEMMETKDTEAKQLAFVKGIFDAFAGREPPRPQDMDDPHGVDYARRDGFLVALPIAVGGMDRREAGRMGGSAQSRRKAAAARMNGRKGGRPAQFDDDSETQEETEAETQADNPSENPSTEPNQNNPSFKNKNRNKNKNILEEDDGGDITRTREGRFSTPTMETVLAFAADDTRHACGKIDEQWAREWYTLMAETDPPWCDLHGRTIVSWQRRLISDWRLERRRREGGTGGKGGKPSTTGGVRRDINAPYQEPGLAEEIMNAGTRRLEGRFRG